MTSTTVYKLVDGAVKPVEVSFDCPVVLVVWFDKLSDEKRDPDLWSEMYQYDNKTHKQSFKTTPPSAFGQPLWCPKGQPVYRWAIDYVVAGEERRTIFGPYKDAMEARKASHAIVDRVGYDAIEGMRIINEHCCEYFYKPEQKMWTDG